MQFSILVFSSVIDPLSDDSITFATIKKPDVRI